MTHDALRMRLRRMCEIKARSKKCHVDDETHKQYMKGGEGREWLEIALAEAIERLGTERNQHKKLRAPCHQDTSTIGPCDPASHLLMSPIMFSSILGASRLNLQHVFWWSGKGWKWRRRKPQACGWRKTRWKSQEITHRYMIAHINQHYNMFQEQPKFVHTPCFEFPWIPHPLRESIRSIIAYCSKFPQALVRWLWHV